MIAGFCLSTAGQVNDSVPFLLDIFMASFLGFMVLGFYPWVSFHKVENLHPSFHFDGGVFSLGAHIFLVRG